MSVAAGLRARWQGLRVLVVHRMRLRNPWNYKAPLLVALVYLSIGFCEVPAMAALLAMFGALATIAGIAGVAYFLNDLGDVRQDLAAGKDNAVAAMGASQRASMLAGFAALALLPWYWLPITPWTAWLLVAEFSLFILYSLPPFRWKERGWLGLLSDALYAHALPAVLGMLTFAALVEPRSGEAQSSLYLMVLAVFAWQLALGLRNIVLHQLLDHGNDLAGGVRTLAVSRGPEALRRCLARLLLPMEALGFCALAWVAWERLPWLLPALVAHSVFAYWRIQCLGLPQPKTLREYLGAYVDNYYADWLPLLILADLVARTPSAWPLLLLHLLVFRNGLRQSWRDFGGRLAPGRP